MKRRILIVDDDKLNLKITKMNLTDYGYEVFTAEKGMEAISFLLRQEVDLILLDIEMPIVNGIRTLELIRQRPEMAEIPVIFLTASADTESVVEACRLEAIDYVVKPCVPRNLIARIEKALRECGK
jgi:putative two-component system response regulator